MYMGSLGSTLNPKRLDSKIFRNHTSRPASKLRLNLRDQALQAAVLLQPDHLHHLGLSLNVQHLSRFHGGLRSSLLRSLALKIGM